MNLLIFYMQGTNKSSATALIQIERLSTVPPNFISLDSPSQHFKLLKGRLIDTT